MAPYGNAWCCDYACCVYKLEFHGTDTDNDTYTDFRKAPIV